ncbi:tricarboxylate transport protein [Trichomonascus vanleenenianus]|uniref:tricarboxylate transport protein n=1 Tax=Trichomonascus vanleenenianus TaxID=2268995 RepID=UPI003EC96EBA
MTEGPIKAEETLLSSTIAGMTASAIEVATTYPLEYAKTRHQLYRNLTKEPFNLPTPGPVYYKGCSALIAGGVAKSMIRYSIYNKATKFMTDGFRTIPGEDDETAVAAAQIVVAGMFTAFCESLVVVPFESIKTTMIERSMATAHAPHAQHLGTKPVSPNKPPSKSRVRPAARPSGPHLHPIDPSITGLTANVRDMYAHRGLRAFVQGFMPTMTRQIANSFVRFTTYNFMKQAISPNPHEPISSALSVSLGVAAGAFQVIATQPIDVIKTRMQSINARSLYGSSLMCTYRIFIEEGPRTLWTGTLPRLVRTSLSGGIFFTIYEGTNRIVAHGLKETPFV